MQTICSFAFLKKEDKIFSWSVSKICKTGKLSTEVIYANFKIRNKLESNKLTAYDFKRKKSYVERLFYKHFKTKFTVHKNISTHVPWLAYSKCRLNFQGKLLLVCVSKTLSRQKKIFPFFSLFKKKVCVASAQKLWSLLLSIWAIVQTTKLHKINTLEYMYF